MSARINGSPESVSRETPTFNSDDLVRLGREYEIEVAEKWIGEFICQVLSDVSEKQMDSGRTALNKYRLAIRNHYVRRGAAQDEQFKKLQPKARNHRLIKLLNDFELSVPRYKSGASPRNEMHRLFLMARKFNKGRPLPTGWGTCWDITHAVSSQE